MRELCAQLKGDVKIQPYSFLQVPTHFEVGWAPRHTRGCRWIPRQLCNSLSVTDRQVSQSMDRPESNQLYHISQYFRPPLPSSDSMQGPEIDVPPSKLRRAPIQPGRMCLSSAAWNRPPSCWGPWEMIAVAGHCVHFWRQWFHGHLSCLAAPRKQR